jgi:hypothetical protein
VIDLWRRSLFLTPEEQTAALVSAGFSGVVLEQAVGKMVLVAGRVSG